MPERDTPPSNSLHTAYADCVEHSSLVRREAPGAGRSGAGPRGLETIVFPEGKTIVEAPAKSGGHGDGTIAPAAPGYRACSDASWTRRFGTGADGASGRPRWCT